MRVLIVLSLVVAAACSRGDAPAQPPDITGEITQLSVIAGGVSMLIEEVPTETSGGAKALVRTDASTLWKGLPQQTAGTLRTGAPPGLRTGMRVDVWFDGPAAMSYPVQAKAAAVSVLPPR